MRWWSWRWKRIGGKRRSSVSDRFGRLAGGVALVCHARHSENDGHANDCLVDRLGALSLRGECAAGYSHYWRWHTSQPDPAALARCRADMDRIVLARREILEPRTFKIPFGDAGEVEVLALNGKGDDAHESFGFPLAPFTADDPSFQFVKTLGKPYDEVVTACLIVARDCFGHDVLTIHSDGDWQAWSPGANLYEKVLHRTARNPLTPSARSDESADQAPPNPIAAFGWPRLVLIVGFLGAVALLVRRRGFG